MVQKAIQEYKKEEEVQLLKDSKVEQEKILAEAHKEIEKEADLKKNQQAMKLAIDKVRAEFKAEEEKERNDKLAQARFDKERWRGTIRYKVINFSWKALAIYIVYFLINFKVLEYPLTSITFIDEFLFPILIRS
jgi:hypothetical protein